MREPSLESMEETAESSPRTSESEKLYEEFITWRLNPEPGKIKTKPNAIRKLWKKVQKEDFPPFNEEEWLRKLGWIIEEFINKKLTLIRLIIGDPLFTPIEKELLQEILEYFSTLYPQLSFHLCFNNTRELKKDERETILKESHQNQLGEHNTLDREKKLGHWAGMDNDVKKFVKKCPIFQLQKTTRIYYTLVRRTKV